MKLLELRAPFATKNLGFVTTAGIPSHKPAERAAACVSSSTRRRLRERTGSEGERKAKDKAVERERERAIKAVLRSSSVFRCGVDSPGLEMRGGPLGGGSRQARRAGFVVLCHAGGGGGLKV